MSYEARRSMSGLNRRAALGGVGVAAVAMGMGHVPHAKTQAEVADLDGHPLLGTWVVMTTGGVVPQTHSSDGAFIAAFPPNYVDPISGMTFQGSGLGRWESTGERSGRFTFLQAHSDSDGAAIGTFQLSAELEASEDGQSWTGIGAGAHIIVRDAANTVISDQVVPIDPPVTATRMGATIESVVFPTVKSIAGTPTSP